MARYWGYLPKVTLSGGAYLLNSWRQRPFELCKLGVRSDLPRRAGAVLRQYLTRRGGRVAIPRPRVKRF